MTRGVSSNIAFVVSRVPGIRRKVDLDLDPPFVQVWQYEAASVLGMPSSPKMVKSFPVNHNKVKTVEELFQKSGTALAWHPEGTEIRLTGFTTNAPSTRFPIALR